MGHPPTSKTLCRQHWPCSQHANQLELQASRSVRQCPWQSGIFGEWPICEFYSAAASTRGCQWSQCNDVLLKQYSWQKFKSVWIERILNVFFTFFGLYSSANLFENIVVEPPMWIWLSYHQIFGQRLIPSCWFHYILAAPPLTACSYNFSP